MSKIVKILLFICFIALNISQAIPAQAQIGEVAKSAIDILDKAQKKELSDRINSLIPPPTGKCPISGDTCLKVTTENSFLTLLKKDKNIKPENIGYCKENTTVPCNYTLCDVLQAFINITRFLLGIIGSIVLLFFMYASILFITAQGDAEKVTKGRKAIRAAVTGLIIVMLSYQIVGILLSVLVNQGSILGGPKQEITFGNLTSPWDSLEKLQTKCNE